ncbi:MAG: hypothetical protein LBJ70_00950 [Holosporales bacterium]|nr:hypothetical protein [Holosporales bacterium]
MATIFRAGWEQEDEKHRSSDSSSVFHFREMGCIPREPLLVVDHIKVESQDTSAVSAREKALIGGQRHHVI